jgi:hypothetical protein
MKPFKARDRSFLRLAWLAGLGGALNLGFSIGMPIERALRHQEWTPGFFFFALWGLCALAGCAACIATYYSSGDPPPKGPRGGMPVRRFTVIEGAGKTEQPSERTKRAA